MYVLQETHPAVFNSQIRSMVTPLTVKRTIATIISISDFTERLEEIGYLPKKHDEDTSRLKVANTKIAEYNRFEISFVLWLL